jgi:hypothetical protein
MGERNDFPSPREPGPDRRDNVTSAGLDPDTWHDLEAWRTESGLKRSEATRRLIKTGLEHADDGEEGITDRLASAVAIILLTGYPTVAAADGRLGTAAGFIGLVAVLIILKPQLSQVWNRLLELMPSVK